MSGEFWGIMGHASLDHDFRKCPKLGIQNYPKLSKIVIDANS